MREKTNKKKQDDEQTNRTKKKKKKIRKKASRTIEERKNCGLRHVTNLQILVTP